MNIAKSTNSMLKTSISIFDRVRQMSVDEYEPVTLRGMTSSCERYPNKQKYGISFVTGYEFAKLREAKTLEKKQGRGNKLKAADKFSYDELELLHESG